MLLGFSSGSFRRGRIMFRNADPHSFREIHSMAVLRMPARGPRLHGRLRFSLIAAIFAAICTAICCAPSGMRAQQQPDRPAVPSLEFHSGFWVNLQHFLYLQARVRNDPAGGAPKAYATSTVTAGMTPAEQKTWNNAVAVYAQDWSSRDLLHSGVMPLINNRLAELENCPEITGKSASQCTSGLQSGLAAALIEAAPIYRARWWPEQDRENRAWIEALAPVAEGGLLGGRDLVCGTGGSVYFARSCARNHREPRPAQPGHGRTRNAFARGVLRGGPKCGGNHRPGLPEGGEADTPRSR